MGPEILLLLIPGSIRILMIVSLLLLLLMPLTMRYALPFIRGISSLMGKGLENAFLLFVIMPMSLYVRFRLNQKEKQFWLIHQIEGILAWFLRLYQRFHDWITDYFSNKWRVKKIYKRAFVLSIVVIWFLLQVPNNAVAQMLTGLDRWIIEDQLRMRYLSFTEAAAMILEEMFDGDSQGNRLLYIRLQPGLDGANIRREPSLDSKSIEVVKPGDIIYYLGEDVTDQENREWYKVRTKSGVEGWISSKVVSDIE